MIFDLLIGQNFIDHPSVLAINSSKYFVITRWPDNTEIPLINIENKYSVNTINVLRLIANQPKWESKCGDISETVKNKLKRLVNKYKDFTLKQVS